MNFKTKIIKIEGKDINSFFQNLITNDIKLLENKQAVYSAMLTPQGKFLLDFIIIKNEGSLILEVNDKDVCMAIELIKKYDFRNTLKVSIESKVKTYFILFKNIPSNIKLSLKKEKILRIDKSYIFLDPRKESFFLRVWAIDFKETILPKKLMVETSKKSWNLERIKNNVPDSSLDLEKEKSFILNFGFNELNAVSFNKGCYIGQENTSRQNYRGNIKYLLKTIKLVSGNFPTINSVLFANKKKIGVMKSHEEDYGLALLRSDIFEKENSISLDDENIKFLII